MATKVIVGRRSAIASAAAGGLLFLFSSAATGAETALVTIDSSAPSLEEDDAAGGWKASLGFTNLTDGVVVLTARPDSAEDKGCKIQLDTANLPADTASLPAAEHSDLIVTIPAACDVGEDFTFIVSAESESPAAGTGPTSFEVTAAPKPDTSRPEWSALWAFPIAFGVLLFAAFLYFVIHFWIERKGFNTELQYLDTAWSFNDSWVSNVTVLAGLLAGVFGSTDVVTALIGEDAESAVALAVVGAAVAAAFIAAGPIVLLATKSKPTKDKGGDPAKDRKGDFFTLGGLLLASVFTLAGAAGELWVVYRSGQTLALGGGEDYIVWLAIAGLVLLALYAARSIPATIRIGTTAPEASGPSDTLAAAALIVEALIARPGFDREEFFKGAAGHLQQVLPKITSERPARPPRRSALL